MTRNRLLNRILNALVYLGLIFYILWETQGEILFIGLQVLLITGLISGLVYWTAWSWDGEND